MHRTQGHKRALALVLCALFSVAIFGVIARAAGGGGTLKVNLQTTDEAFINEFSKADVVVDVYRFAAATHGSDGSISGYEIDDAFSSLADDFEAARFGEGDWQALSESAAALAEKLDVEGQPVAVGQPVGEAIDIADDGIYFVLARGRNEKIGSRSAYGTKWEHVFQASLVAVPTQDKGEDGIIHVDSSGPWISDVEANLKMTHKPLYGSLVITKTVTEMSGSEPSTFTFHIVGEGYENYAAITYPEQTSTTVTHIPAGIKVTVTEVYSGGRYQEKKSESGTGGSGTEVTILSDHAIKADKTLKVPSVDFVNEPSGDHPGGGHGVENHFEINEKGDWPITATPSNKLVESKEAQE